MVRRLVRRRLLRALTGTKSARAEEREPAGLARRLVAASYQGHAHGGAFQYSAGVPIRGLWFPDRAVLDCLKVQPRPACARPRNSGANSARATRGCKNEIWVHVRMSECGTVHRLCA